MSSPQVPLTSPLRSAYGGSGNHMTKRTAAVVFAVLLWTLLARADEWPAPGVQNVFSPNGQYFVRVVPMTTVNRPAGAASSTQARARGEFYMRQPDRSYRLTADVELQNRVSPTYAIVTDDGYFVTFDQWFESGIGQVLAFYRPTGALIRAVTIEELYSPEKLAQLPRSISSRSWRCHVFYTPPAGGESDALTVFEYFGGSFSLHPRTGAFEYRSGTAVCPAGSARVF